LRRDYRCLLILIAGNWSASMNAAAQGSPDWQGNTLTEDFIVVTAYDDEHLFFAIPRNARLARKADNSPQFFLEFVSDRNDARIEDSLYAVIDLGFECSGDFSAAYDTITKGVPSAALMPATFTTGTYCHLECGDGHETVPFAWDAAQRATLHSRISTQSAQLIYGALGKGSISVAKAAIECGMGAFLPRLEATVRFNAADLLASLAKLNPGGSSVPFQQMVKLFDEPPGDVLRFDGNDRGGSGLGLALAGRVRHYFGRPAPCPKISDGPHVALKLPADDAQGVTGWDLRTPLFTESPVFIDFDPFTPIVSAGDRKRVTGFIPVLSLPDDLRTRRVTVASGLPRGLRNCDSIELTLRVNKALSASGATAVRSVNLFPAEDQSSSTVDLEYNSIAGAKPFSARITVVCQGNIMELPWFDCDSDYLYLDASQLPGSFVTIWATPELLKQAAVSLALNVTAAENGALSATLTAAEPVATFILLALHEAARLAITAHDPANPDKALTLDLPCRSVTAELSSFRDYGPQTTNATVRFKDSIASVQVEFLAECAGAKPIVLEFSASRLSMKFTYFSNEIFRNRYRFRRHSSTDEPEAAWSDYRSPGDDLVIDVSQGPHGATLHAAGSRKETLNA
jgi:hypothetical protein